MIKLIYTGVVIIGLIGCFGIVQGQTSRTDNCLVLMFYNVENYFDTINNPNAQDDFTPDDIYEWTHERFVKKRNAIAQVIMAVNNGGVPPDIIGLCEVENRFVLHQLVNNTVLKNYGYSILHHNSHDIRGIDVALLYRHKQFRLLDSAFLPMGYGVVNIQSREILYAKGLVNNTDTLHLFVCHFPSKRSGATKTAPLRMAAAQALRKSIDSLLIKNNQANILAMGDFNDTFNSHTLKDGLGAVYNIDSAKIVNNKIYNITAGLAKAAEGSTKYRNRWQLVDMFLVSGNMLNSQSQLYSSLKDVSIFKADFLLEYVAASNSYRPKPTYRWVNYIGGYSDHLPVLMRIKVK